MESIYRQYYEEPRYRPQLLTRRMLDAGLLGRKRGAGFYRYVDGQPQRPPAPGPPAVAAPRVWIDPRDPELAARVAPALASDVALDGGARPAADSLIVVTPLGGDVTGAIVASRLDAGRAVGLDAWFPGREVRCLFANPALAEPWRARARAAFTADGIDVYLVRDSVGLIAQRVLAHVVNVATSIAEQRIASPGDIDQAVRLGLGYPQGPLAWGDAVGPARIQLALEGLVRATGDPRYRPTAWLTRRAALGLSLTHDD
jgi:3-hydroxybutyryl-CoA dehydrogenase